MIFTKKSIEKNLKTVTEENELITGFLAIKSNVYKRGVLAISSFGRFIVTNAPLIGKLKIKDSFVSEDVESIDFVSEIKMGGPHVHILMKIKGTDTRFTAFFHPVNNDVAVNEIIQTIYKANPSAIPDYLKDKEIIDFLTTKDGIYKLTTNEIIVQKYSNNKIEDKEVINVKDITYFDVYPQKMGSKGILYLEVNNEPRVVKYEKPTEENSVKTMLSGGTSAMFGLGKLAKMFSDSEIRVNGPSYMGNDEEELVTEFATKKSKGIEELGNKIFRLTDKNIFLLKKEKGGKLKPTEKIAINNIKTYQKMSEIGNNVTVYGLSIVTKENVTYKFWSLDFIDKVMDELKRLFN
ncbi:MAG: hypothetical protein L3J35_09175 [Bacteroidales bacterium]|nr:hypothetical protein [Bacteroidales bacterium]